MRRLAWCGLSAGLLLCCGRAEASFGFSGAGSIWGIQVDGPVAIGDATGDGRDDLVALVGDRIHVYAQRAEGGFGDPAIYDYKGSGWADAASDLQVGDVDGDGVGDIVVGGSGTLDLAILRSNRDDPAARRLEVYADAAWTDARRLALVDVNDDGRIDIVQALGNGASGALRVWSMRDPRGRRVFARPASLPTAFAVADVHAGDIDGDHLLDLVASSLGTNQVGIRHGMGRGRFTAETVRSTGVVPNWFAVGDLTGDGLADLVSSQGLNAPTSLEVQAQLPSGQFEGSAQLGTADRPQAMRIGDIDGDGDDDLLVLHAGDGVGLYLRDAGMLQPEVLSGFYGGVDLAVGDLDSDGCKDVAYAVANGGLTWQYGVGCVLPPGQLPDMAVALAGSGTAVTVAVANGPLGGSIRQPWIQLDLELATGASLQLGSLPPDCRVSAQTTRSWSIGCAIDDLAPNGTRALSLPIDLAGAGRPNADLTARVRATSETAEASYRNNAATRNIRP
jgi:hypothetical protein